MGNKNAKQMVASTRGNRFVNNAISDLQNANRSPIFGYENLPILTLEEAVERLVSLVPGLKNHVENAIKKCNQNSSVLTRDESAAIYLYSMPVPFFSRLNDALRAEKRHALKPWFAFLKLFITALEKLPSLEIIVWRGVSGDNGSNFIDNEVQTWWSVNSCSTALDVVEAYVGQKGVLFAIKVIHGKDISVYSAMPEEQEVVLMPGTRVRAKCKPLNFVNRLLIIHLEEEEEEEHKSKQTTQEYDHGSHLDDKSQEEEEEEEEEEGKETISLADQEYVKNIDFAALIPSDEHIGPEIVQNEKPQLQTYECEGDSAIHLLNPENLEVEAEQEDFMDRDTGTFINSFFIRKLVFHNSSKEPVSVLHLSGEYEDNSGNWRLCKNVMIGPPAGPHGMVSFRHDLSINLTASSVANYAVNMDVEVYGKPGCDRKHRARAHKSLPQPLKLRLIVHDTAGKVCRLTFEQFNKPLILPTQERVARALSINVQQILDWVSVDDCDELVRTFTILYLDENACLHIVTSSSESYFEDRYLSSDHIKSLQKKAKHKKTAEITLEGFGVSNNVQHTALFDPKTFHMYALRIILQSTTSKTTRTIQLPIDMIKGGDINCPGSIIGVWSVHK